MTSVATDPIRTQRILALTTQNRFPTWGTRTLILVIGVLIWQIVSSSGLVDTDFLPSPVMMAAELPKLVVNPEFHVALRSTGTGILLAFLMAVVIGTALGSVIGSISVAREAFEGPLNVLMSMPKVIFFPIFLLVFGLGEATATAFGTFEASVYMAVYAATGVQEAQQKYLRMAHAYGAGGWGQFVHVRLPAAMPSVFAGVWYSIKHAFTGVLLAELFVSTGGIGAMIRHTTELSQVATSFALILVMSLLMIVVGSLVNRIEARVNRWSGKDA